MTAAVIVAFCYVLVVFPYCLDELAFLREVEDNGTFSAMKTIFTTASVRLSNMAIILLLNVPDFIRIAIAVLAFAAGILLMLKVAGIKPARWKCATVMLALFVFVPMWHEGMFSFAYSYNYIVPIPMLFGMIYVYFHPDRFPMWFAMSLGLILGAWHESYSLVFLGGCFVLFVQQRKVSIRQLWIVFAVTCGFLCILLSPGSRSRSESLMALTALNTARLAFDWIYFAYVLTWLYALCNKKHREAAKSPLAVFTLGAGIFIPFVVLYGLARAGMGAIVLCCCTWPLLLADIFKKTPSVVKSSIAAVLYVVTLLHLAALCFETHKIINYYERVSAVLDAIPKEQEYAFAPAYYSYQAPAITLRRPIWRLFEDKESSTRFLQNYRRANEKLMLVPEELREYKASGDGVQIWNGHIVSTNPADSAFHSALVRYEGSDRLWNVEISSVGFPAADGSEYLFIYPKRTITTRYLGKPKEIKLGE